tara:strand:+ start:917 stop:1387 length:471 start_codon:yes stop_codon:yes gene_type:complete
MDYNKLIFSDIELFKKGNNILVSYYGQKIKIRTPVLKCKSSITKQYNKYGILLDLNSDYKFINFLKNLDTFFINNSLNDGMKYKNSFYYLNNCWKLKVPYKYNNYEIDISSKNNYLSTSSDITENINVVCEVELSNIWIYKNTYGCLWILKKIDII